MVDVCGAGEEQDIQNEVKTLNQLQQHVVELK